MMRFSRLAPVAAGAVALVAALAKPTPSRADGEAETTALKERCATRLAIAFTGKSASPELAASANPQDGVEALLADPLFFERFARFINSELNPEAGMMPGEDAAYTLTKHVMTDGKLPWKDMFVGAYDVTDAVTPNANGLGYFRSKAWMERYAGNEAQGYRLAAAYRIMQNTTGLELVATTNVEGVDDTAAGRQNVACAGCHYTGWFALDLVAKTLTKTKRDKDGVVTFPANSVDGPQTVLGGKTIANDKELVQALVDSDNFKVNTCRLAFKFLYGRAETTCEGPVFDKCVDAFSSAGTMQSALSTIAKDATFCQ
ncbi:MAG: hypothetical protein KIT84_25220 [Labilithrix sp.]|nr:hypothetical protein [Labilithrix sp.]MCW5814353.1 hypothetical protein [Labilithrix sp.]